MKISKRQLKKIIREEYSRILSEQTKDGIHWNISFDDRGFEVKSAETGNRLGRIPTGNAEWYSAAKKASRGDETGMRKILSYISRKVDYEVDAANVEFINEPTHESISRSQLSRIIRESMKNLYGDIENEILMIGQGQGGELVVQDVVDHFSGYANDPMGDPRANYVGQMTYDEALDIMYGMVEAGLLVGGYEDFFDVHPDYMTGYMSEALGDRGDLPQKHQYKIGMTGGDLPYGNVTGKVPRVSKPAMDPDVAEWVTWGEGYGLQQEEDNEGQLIFYFDLNDDVDGTILNEAEFMGGDVQSTGSYDGNMIIYTGVYISDVDLGPYIQ